MALARLDPSKPVVVEAESSKVGNCRLPPELWKAMIRAPRLAIAAPRAERAAYLTRAYHDMVDDAAGLATVIEQLRGSHARETVDAWQRMAQAGDFTALADGLMADHYDPRYEKHRARMEVPGHEIAADSLADADLPALADRIAAAVGASL